MSAQACRFLNAVPTVVMLVGIGGLFGLFAVRAFHERGLAVDDAYILTRYASHLADGYGFRWNITSPPVEGFTSPLFVTLLAALLRMGLESTTASVLLSVLAVGGVITLLIVAADPRRPGFVVAAAPIVFLLLDPGIGVHASRGLETSVFFLAATGVVAATGRLVRRQNRSASHALAAASLLLILTRPDGALIVAVCWAAAALATRFPVDRSATLLPGLVTLVSSGALCAAWKLWYFGTLLPTAFDVKASGVGWAGIDDVGRFVSAYWPWLLAMTLAAVVGLGEPGRAAGRWRHTHLVALIPSAIAVPWLIYAARIVHESGFVHRFSFVLVPLAAIGAVCSLRAVVDGASESRLMRPAARMSLGAALLVALALVSIAPVSRSLAVLRGPVPTDPNVEVFARLGQAIANAGLGEQISFLNGTAGAAPYFAGARHVDSFGLATSELSKRVPLDRRNHIIVESAFDVIEWPFLPASPGASSVSDEPLRDTEYWKYLEQVGRHLLPFQTVPGGLDDWFRQAHWAMRYLRDNTTLVGAARLPGSRMIVYVNNSSPYYRQLVDTLTRTLDIPPADVR